jgi:hypothetical protein
MDGKHDERRYHGDERWRGDGGAAIGYVATEYGYDGVAEWGFAVRCAVHARIADRYVFDGDDNGDAGGDAMSKVVVQPITGTVVVNTTENRVVIRPASANGGGAVDSVNGQTGVVVLDAADVGAYPDTNPSGFVDSAGAAAAAPVQSVNGETGVVVLGAGDVGAEVAWTVTTANSGTLTGVNVIWLADTSAARNRTLDTAGERLQVKDTTGSAGTNNITLTAGSGQTINGNATEVVDVNYGWVEYVRNGTNWVTIGGQA